MLIVNRYIANDGSEHTDASKALERDALVKRVDDVMAPLGAVLTGESSEFVHGGGYAVHKVQTVLAVRAALCEIARGVFPHEWFDQTIKNGFDVDSSWAVRLMGDIGGPLERAWYRICCIGRDGREYGQPYYASNPQEAKDVEYPVKR